MNTFVKAVLFWAPRVLGILFILFLGMFSLDVFEMGGGFWMVLAGFLMHNIVPIILLIALILGWKWEWIGAAGFFLGALRYLLIARFRDPVFLLVFAGLPLLVAALFLTGWVWRKKIRG